MAPIAVLSHTSDRDNTSKPSVCPVDEGIHAYKCPQKGDIRSVCPALNTLANHSYLPHDGKNISFFTLSHALQAGYGISPMFADFLVCGSYMLLRRSVLTPLDLHEIGQHNRIEHNASVVHDDDVNGAKDAPTHVDPVLLHKFLSKAYTPPSARSEGITVEDVARTRVAREAAVKKAPDALHAEIARGEFAMVLNILSKGTDKTLNPDDLELWLKENRFPPHWAPTHQETLFDTIAESKKIRELMMAYRGEEPHGLLADLEKSFTMQGEEFYNMFSTIGNALESWGEKCGRITNLWSHPAEGNEKSETGNQ